jgi:hypothetical protein
MESSSHSFEGYLEVHGDVWIQGASFLGIVHQKSLYGERPQWGHAA